MRNIVILISGILRYVERRMLYINYRYERESKIYIDDSDDNDDNDNNNSGGGLVVRLYKEYHADIYIIDIKEMYHYVEDK